MDVAQQISHRFDLQNDFGDIQFCGAAFGMERMQNAMNIHLTTRSDLTYSSSDYEDAYCHADRSKILSGIARVIPALLPQIHRRLEAVQDIKQAVGSGSPRVRPPAGNCTVWEFTPPTISLH
jgi:hypothetical protein